MDFANIPEVVIEKLRLKGPENRIALVGASGNTEKYGNIIFKNLLGKGYDVVPVNRRDKEVEGVIAFPHVNAIEGPVGLVNFVVPPPVTLAVLKEINPGGVDAVWFQDGSFNNEVIEYAQEHFQYIVFDACIMVVTNYT
jgi:uncharacterized protein